MFGLFKKKTPRSPAEELKSFMLDFAKALLAFRRGWDPNSIQQQMQLISRVGSSLVALRQTFPALPIEPEGALTYLVRNPIGTDGYDEGLPDYIFRQLAGVEGDPELTLNVMAYLMSPAAFAAKAESMGVKLEL